MFFGFQECVSATGGVGVGGGSTGTGAGVDMPSSFVPTVTAITTSQDLQWMVQPTLISSVAPGQSASGSSTMTQPVALDPYDLPGPSFSSPGSFTPPSSDTPGPVRQSRSRRRARDETVSGGTMTAWLVIWFEKSKTIFNTQGLIRY